MIDSICKEYGIENYTINPDGSIDVIGDVNLYNRGLTKLPLKFDKVTGNFYCRNNQLTSLLGCPESVGDNFDCSFNQLTSLDGCPKSVGGYFKCIYNQLLSLKGSPKSVGGYFDCDGNKLISLIGWSGKSLYCNDNPVEVIWNLFRPSLYVQSITSMRFIDKINHIY